MSELYKRRWLLIRLPVGLVGIAAAAYLWLVVYPMPPMQLSITTAGRGDAYFKTAERYAQAFSTRGIELVVQPSAGSLQNQERLQLLDEPSDLALMQGGFGYLGNSVQKRGRSRIQTLANVDVEAFWIFNRQGEIDSFNQLEGKRVAVGPDGSGNRVVALKLLQQARVDLKDLTLSSQFGLESVQALEQKQIDVVMMVAPIQSATVQAMLKLPGIQIGNLRKAAAIAERNPYLELRLLAQGALDGKLPQRDTTLLTTSTSLLAREDLNPALKRLAIAVAMETHTKSSVFYEAGDFPSLRRIDFPTAPQARRTMLHGLPFLERTLPFWWVQVAQRALLIVLPIALLAIWLARVIPNCLRWTLQSKVNRWYGELKYIENDLALASTSGLDLTRFAQRLEGIDKALIGFTCPPDLMARCYTLHQHIEFVRQRLYRMRGR